MTKQKLLITVSVTLICLALFSIAAYGVYKWQFQQNASWFRTFEVTVETGSLIEVPKAKSNYVSNWGWGDFERPELQHNPFIVDASYSDARFFLNNTSTYPKGPQDIAIYSPQKLIFHKDIDQEHWIKMFRFTPDLSRFYYTMHRWDQSSNTVSTLSRVVTDTWTSEEYSGISQPVFSADGKHVAFTAQRDSERSIIAGVPQTRSIDIIVDGKVVATHDVGTVDGYNGVDNARPMVSFNPINNKIAYVINDRDDANWMKGISYVVYDGIKGPEYSQIDGAPIFSEDGSAMAYSAYTKGLYLAVGLPANEMVAVCNGKAGPPAFNVLNLTLNKDGSVCAYTGQDQASYFVMANGEVLDVDQNNPFNNLKVGDDGTIAYTVGRCSHYHLGESACETVIGETPMPFTPFVKTMLDSGVFATISQIQTGEAPVGMGWDVESGGSPPMEPVYADMLTIDSETGALMDFIEEPVINVQRKIVAYLAQKDQKKYLMIGGNQFGPYDDIWPPIFENGSVVAVVRNGRSLYRMVIHLSDE